MPTVNRTPTTVNDQPQPPAPKPPANPHPDLCLTRSKALEAHILSEALAEALAELPASEGTEKLQTLANLSERASRETFEDLDAHTAAKS